MERNLSFGTMLLNGIPALPGTPYPDNATVTFGDSVSGYTIHWVSIPGKKYLVAKSTLLTNISWRQLRDLGFVDGRPFILSGNLYLMRLPWLGTAPESPNELNGSPFDDICCWGHELFIDFSDKKRPKQHASVFGGPDSTWSSMPPAEKKTSLGFRPVLEPGLNR